MLARMSVYMRAILTCWDDPPFDDLAVFVEERSEFRVHTVDDRGWPEWVIVNTGTTVLAGDLWTGSRARGELDELLEFVDDLVGSASARRLVQAHLCDASAIVAMQIVMSVYDDSVAAANVIIEFLEQRPGVLTQVDTIGWYDGENLILAEPD